MGRLFWSFDRAMKSDCMAIQMAIDGQADFLQSLFGPATAPAAPKAEDLPPLTPAAFRAFGKR